METLEATGFAPALVAAAADACEAMPFPDALIPEPSDDAATPPPALVLAADLAGPATGTVTLVLGVTLAMAFMDGGDGEPVDVIAAFTPSFEALGVSLASAMGPIRQVEPSTLLTSSGAADVLPLSNGSALVAAFLFDVSLPAPARVTSPSEGESAADRPFPKPAPAHPVAALSGGIDVLRSVEMEITVEIGRTRLTVAELLALAPGQVVELDRAAGTPADLYVNGLLLARGEIVVVDEDYGLRVTEILNGAENNPNG